MKVVNDSIRQSEMKKDFSNERRSVERVRMDKWIGEASEKEVFCRASSLLPSDLSRNANISSLLIGYSGG